jgi:PAS domain S-box-containing protein
VSARRRSKKVHDDVAPAGLGDAPLERRFAEEVTGRMPRANAVDAERQGEAWADLGLGSLERAHARLQHLYEVSKLLIRFSGIEATVLAIVEIVRRALSLRSAIFILDAERSPRTIIWHADDVDEAWLRASKARARASYAYLAGTERASHPELSEAAEKAGPPQEDLERWPPVLLPLAVQHRPIFGALQLESAQRFDEPDVVFVNAIVNQLAVALDRYVIIESRQALADHRRLQAEDRQISAEAKQVRAEREEAQAREQRLSVERQKTFVEAERVAAQRKQAAAEALRERYEALVDNLDRAFVWEAAPDTYQVSYVSGRAEVLLGFPRQRWLDESDFWMNCVHPKDRGQLIQTFALALLERKDKRYDHRCITADGRVLWFHTGVHVAERDSGPLLQGVSLDITKTKEAERNLRGQLDFTRAVTNSLGEGVIAVDLDSRVTLFNPAAAQMLGWRPDEALGQPVARVVRIRAADGAEIPEDRSPFGGAMRRGQSSSSEAWLFAGKNERAFPASHISAPLEREGRISGAVLAFQDITERRQAERALERAVELAQRATHDREELMALVSHDLKNPLSVILMTAASIARKFDASESSQQKEQFQTIRRSAERMNRLIRDLLDVASVDAGKLIVEPQSIAVASLVDEAIEAIRPLAAAKALAIVSELSPDVRHVWADPSRLQQVFANLLGNALKFSSQGGSIIVRAEPVGDRVRFAVADNGPGIAQDDLAHLFDRFWQAPRTARLGSGLGLSIVKGIVQAHEGRVWVESKLGAGSTFFFTLRAA